MIDLAGKTAVVFGLANKRSIAWGIAQKLHAAGATLAICYQNERMRLEAEGLIEELPGAAGFQCDVANDTEIDSLFAELQDPVRHVFQRCGLLQRVGEDRLFLTVDDGVQDYLKRHPAAGRAS